MDTLTAYSDGDQLIAVDNFFYQLRLIKAQDGTAIVGAGTQTASLECPRSRRGGRHGALRCQSRAAAAHERRERFTINAKTFLI